MQKPASKWTSRTASDGPVGGLTYQPLLKTDYKSTAWGRLRDDVAKAGKDRWTVACIKATSRFRSPPDEKQLRTILAGLREGGRANDRNMPLGVILHQLRARLDSSDWAVVLKTQIVFHTILRSGNQYFVDYVANALPDLFQNDSFNDMSAGGMVHTPFIRTYALYLQQWLHMRECIAFPATKTTDASVKRHFQHASMEKLLDGLPLVMSTISIVNSFDLNPRIKKSSIVHTALFLLLRDQTTFVTALSKGIESLTQLFYTSKREEAIRALDIYVGYRRMLGRLQFVIEGFQSIYPGWCVPIDVNAKCLTEDMQKYIDECLGDSGKGHSAVGLWYERTNSDSLVPHASTPYPSYRSRRAKRVISEIAGEFGVGDLF